MKTRLWKYPYDVEKTELWLNELASNGFTCVGADTLMSRYTFEQGEPGEYTYRYVLFDKCFGHSKSIEYLSFLKENGIECVGHLFQHVLLRKRVDDGKFNLFTDKESQIKYYKRILATDTILGTIVIWLFMIIFIYSMISANINIANGIGHISSHFHPLLILAYTIGLVNVGIGISYIAQWRRYALRIKNLKCDSAIFE
ncbi:MAG: DUF2812 domain-containing protein [Defluviitaleaceae bacterium]|nr:DUF2812 domain-containing protein [Defluviitaleaceae bacterium]